jgi:hypothetical protein
MRASIPEEVTAGLGAGTLLPYLGPGLLELVGGGAPVPSTPEALSALLTARVTVPHKIRTRLTAAAQFIENFKHRKTLVAHMKDAFAAPVVPSALHAHLAALPLPMLVAVWYDATMATALAGRADWGCVQGLAQSQHLGTWTGYFDCRGAPAGADDAAAWRTLLYQPIGSVAPAANFLVSDSDFVEVLTEIDIQTPIPPAVQRLRHGRGFLFLGCRFQDQLQRTFARQIMKRSGGRHWAVLPGALTRNEARFLQEQQIERLDYPLAEFAAALIRSGAARGAGHAAAALA